MLAELTSELEIRGIEFMRVIDISKLSLEEHRGYRVGILIGKGLPPEYVNELSNTVFSDINKTVFKNTEREVDDLAEWVEGFFKNKGYDAFAQSEKNLLKRGNYIPETRTTPLPHKKLATLSGLGWIGKNNLLCTTEYGCALSMCSILVNAPLQTFNEDIITPKCSTCHRCEDICPTKAIHGELWSTSTHRDEIVDVESCIRCLKCLSNCPFTQGYIKRSLDGVTT